jgi:hypothetical protein
MSFGAVTSKGSRRWPTDYALLAFNLIGAMVYVRLASFSWAIPQERGLHSQTGEPFVWAAAVIPIFAIFFMVNVAWGMVILFRRQWRRGYLWLLTALIWPVAAVIDFAHH